MSRLKPRPTKQAQGCRPDPSLLLLGTSGRRYKNQCQEPKGLRSPAEELAAVRPELQGCVAPTGSLDFRMGSQCLPPQHAQRRCMLETPCSALGYVVPSLGGR